MVCKMMSESSDVSLSTECLGCYVQVICGLMSALPPSKWFTPDKPELFLLMASTVIICTLPLAYGYHRAISAVMARAIG